MIIIKIYRTILIVFLLDKLSIIYHIDMINIFKIIFDYCYGIKNIKMMKIKKKRKNFV